jgi:GTP-binding protein
METLGVEETLRKAGVQEGDTVSIGEFELEWQD